MKKFTSVLLTVIICACGMIFTGCGEDREEAIKTRAEMTLTVGASAMPHAEILEEVKKILEEDGYILHIATYNDYSIPNDSLSGDALEANYFQHKLHLDKYNEKNKTNLVSVAEIHFEPMGIYGKEVADIKSVKKGATIIIPEDETNLTRALLLLSQEGLIALAEGVSAESDVITSDMVDSKGYNIITAQADAVSTLLNNSEAGTIAVINGNYAIEAKLNVEEALALESADGDSAKLYANVVAVRKDKENNKNIEMLVKALKSDRIKKFMEEKYKGAVVPLF